MGMKIFFDGMRIVGALFQIVGVIAMTLIGLVVIIGGTVVILRKFVVQALDYCDQVSAESDERSRALALEKKQSQMYYDSETGKIDVKIRAMAEQMADEMVEKRVSRELQERWDALRRAQYDIDPSAKWIVVEFQGVRGDVPYTRIERLNVGKYDRAARIAQIGKKNGEVKLVDKLDW